MKALPPILSTLILIACGYAIYINQNMILTVIAAFTAIFFGIFLVYSLETIMTDSK